MEKLVKNIEELLEVENLDINLKFTDMEEWDSLSVLSILALLDSDYGMNLTQTEIENFSSIADFIKHVEINAK
jgi:acyl carrier protein